MKLITIVFDYLGAYYKDLHWLRQLPTEHTGNDTVCKKTCSKSMFPDTPPSPTLINVVRLLTRLIGNRKKTQHCPGGAGEGAIFAPSLKSTLKDKSVSTILTPIVDKELNMSFGPKVARLTIERSQKWVLY